MSNDPPPDWVLDRRRAVGRALLRARKAARLSQQGLGEQVGLDRRTISAFEYASSDPSLGDLVQIAEACGVPLADLVKE